MSAAALPLETLPMAQTGTWRTLSGVLVVALVAGGIAWWWRTAQWPIEVVQIDGALVHTDRARLKGIVARHARDGFAGMDLHALQRDLVALPWVKSADLRRIWPDTLRVNVREQAPVATWNETALLNGIGQVFRPETVDDTGLVQLTGPNGHGGSMLRHLRQFRQRLASLELRITALQQNARRAWQLTLANGIVLRLGRDRIDQRLARFAAVWPKTLDAQAQRIAAIDLRYTNGFAVAWRDGEHTDARKGGQ